MRVEGGRGGRHAGLFSSDLSRHLCQSLLLYFPLPTSCFILGPVLFMVINPAPHAPPSNRLVLSMLLRQIITEGKWSTEVWSKMNFLAV